MSDIDERVRDLCAAMNEIPGITTYGSCGGHPDPNSCQAAEDEFYVTFFADRNDLGWLGLTILTSAVEENYVEERSGPGVIQVSLDAHAGLRMVVNALDNADPDLLADCIRASIVLYLEGGTAEEAARDVVRIDMEYHQRLRSTS